MLSRTHQKGARTSSELARLGQYPVGSPQSRAAARALLAARKTARFEGILVRLVSVLGCDDPDRKCTCPTPEAGTFAMCRCFL
jgi:hypothetical protein